MRRFRYETLERAVSLVLLVGMVGVILLATVNFFLALGAQSTEAGRVQDYTAFQGLFDKALAAIIALELAHSVHQSVRGEHGIGQLRTVALIGVLAVVRKFVLIDIDTASGLLVLGLGAAVIALGTVFAMTHWIEARLLFARRGEED